MKSLIPSIKWTLFNAVFRRRFSILIFLYVLKYVTPDIVGTFREFTTILFIPPMIALFSLEYLFIIEKNDDKKSVGFAYKSFAKNLIEGTNFDHTSLNALQKVTTKYVMITDVARSCAPKNVILELIKKIRQIVYSKTGLILDPEINLVGFNQRELEKYFKLVN